MGAKSALAMLPLDYIEFFIFLAALCVVGIWSGRGIKACVARQGAAFFFYLMEKPPADLHDIIEGHDFSRDVALRRALIQRGVFFVPIATKQCSLSAALRRVMSPSRWSSSKAPLPPSGKPLKSSPKAPSKIRSLFP